MSAVIRGEWTSAQGTKVSSVLATVNEDGTAAQCAHSGCPVSIQRTVSGDLRDGVRSHYRTVHPERKVS